MIQWAALWHVTPVHLGNEFIDPSVSMLGMDAELYRLVNNEAIVLERNLYTPEDYASLQRIRHFLFKLKHCHTVQNDPSIVFCDHSPDLRGCLCKVQLKPQLFCYILYNGTAVFMEKGEPISFDDDKYFSLPFFLERQKYEDDYCVNQHNSARKETLYSFLDLMRRYLPAEQDLFSTTNDFGNHGVRYTLCMTMIHCPNMLSTQVSDSFLKNVNSLLDTSPFSNIYDQSQWNLIKSRVDAFSADRSLVKELSENLIFADSWSGVVVAGDLEHNQKCINWLMEFEIYLQSHWLLFDAYCENVMRQDLSVIELQQIINRAELIRVSLENDISSNMEQSRHIMRNSLIQSSDINVIYSRMHGLLSNKLKLQYMREDKRKAKYSLLSDICLLFIALMEIYGVLVDLFRAEQFGRGEIAAMVIMLSMAALCIWIMIKGR